jgi:hypothetical protein
MKTIKSLNEIKNITGKVYVRWSKSFNLDRKRGYSLRYGTQAEAGLSVCEINTTWEDWRILRQLNEYSFVGGSCWLVTGDEVGTGADNEPLLRNVKLIGKVADNLAKADWLLMWRNEMIAREQARFENATDDWNRNYSQKLLEKLQSNDRKIWERIMFQGA